MDGTEERRHSVGIRASWSARFWAARSRYEGVDVVVIVEYRTENPGVEQISRDGKRGRKGGLVKTCILYY